MADFYKAALAAKKGKFGRFRLQIWHSICMSRAHMHETGQKTGKTNPKPDFSTSYNHLAEFGLMCCATNQASPEMLSNKSGQTQLDGWRS